MLFSERLEAWLLDDSPKTIDALSELVEEKALAVVLLILMFIPATPIPGASHPLELIAAIVALQLTAGRRTLWLPKRFLCRDLGTTMRDKVIPFIVRRIRWFEKFSRPRFAHLLDLPPARMLTGAVVLVFVVFAFVAPPFTNLDTLPALGVVIISLGMILDDGLFVFLGTVVGTTGVVLVIALGTAAWHVIT